jgi:hypothetical protein
MLYGWLRLSYGIEERLFLIYTFYWYEVSARSCRNGATPIWVYHDIVCVPLRAPVFSPLFANM